MAWNGKLHSVEQKISYQPVAQIYLPYSPSPMNVYRTWVSFLTTTIQYSLCTICCSTNTNKHVTGSLWNTRYTPRGIGNRRYAVIFEQSACVYGICYFARGLAYACPVAECVAVVASCHRTVAVSGWAPDTNTGLFPYRVAITDRQCAGYESNAAK